MISSKTNPARRRKVKRLAEGFGVAVASASVCPGHSAPLDFLTEWVYDRPPISMVHGPRGGGKSYLAALATHIDSINHDLHGTKILGGSLAQSQQIYAALSEFDRHRAGYLRSYTKTSASYFTGSDVSILAASATSVRGPHVPALRLDEVDEIDGDIRDAASGMCMARNGVSPSVSMTSTWHNVAGPMQGLKERAADPKGGFPWHTFCVFEILERCPDSRSGPNLEYCPACPLVKWCHEGGGVPKAKRSAGHYTIASVIQKLALVSPRVFESDYLCRGARAAGLWFTSFDESRHVTPAAEYNPGWPVIVSIDSGVFTGAVAFQVAADHLGNCHINVFADFLSEGASAEGNAQAIVEILRERCNGRIDRALTDPSSASRNAVGPVVTGEYLRAGLKDAAGRLDHWPNYGGSVRASLDLLEALLLSADGTVSLTIHPRCRALIQAFQNFRRAKVGGQWQNYPRKDDHPFEDLIDPLRSGLLAIFPEGRKPPPKYRHVPGRSVF